MGPPNLGQREPCLYNRHVVLRFCRWEGRCPVNKPGSTFTLVACALTLSCGGTVKQSSFEQLKRRFEASQQRHAENQRQLEELNNRVFLLEDRVETHRVAAQRAPRLPVIRLGPEESARAEAPPLAAAVDSKVDSSQVSPIRPATRTIASTEPAMTSGSVVAEDSVEFSGAAQQKGPRPVLRLHGSRSRSSATLAAGDMPTTELGKLAVVPLPKRKAPVATAKRSVATEATSLYGAGMRQYKAGKYSAAAKVFGRFVERFAKHPYADNALYWLGECYYDQGDYRRALTLFRRVVERYPEGNKAPDALLKVAYCYLQLRDKGNARSVLDQVVEIFPKNRVAKLASSALAKLN